jgi:hypothetical protein
LCCPHEHDEEWGRRKRCRRRSDVQEEEEEEEEEGGWEPGVWTTRFLRLVSTRGPTYVPIY